MALKRSAEHSEDLTCVKIFKQMEEDEFDVTLDSVTLSEDFKTSLEYDSVLKTFSISLDKERKEGNRFICFGEEEMRNIVQLLPSIEKIARRYSTKRSPRIIDIPFEACSGRVDDLITIVSLKENSYKRGQFDIDIRKCVKKEETYQYTSDGVRFKQSLVSQLMEILHGYQILIERARQKSKTVMSLAMAKSITRHIQDISDPRNNCHGCLIDHPSQTEHVNGCLSEQQPVWEDVVSQYWHAGKNLVTEDDILTRATHTTTVDPELKKDFIPGLVSTNAVSDKELKELALSEPETDGSQSFKI